MGLEDMVKKILVAGDFHIPYIDKKAYSCFKQFLQDYKPDYLVLNGDIMDMYSLSSFDKNPDRKDNLQDDIIETRKYIADLRKTMKKGGQIHYLEGNHSNRLQRVLWKTPELHGLPELKLPELLHLKKHNVNWVGSDADYWKKDNGHLKLGDMVIMHGDNRLNGASTSKYAGYSAKNTMMTMNQSTTTGHTHRLALVNHSNPYTDLTGLESGCLCYLTGTANWQQGFVTMEMDNGKTYNHQIHRIKEGVLNTNGKKYKHKK